MLNGYKTYIGILIALMGAMGYGELITEGEAVHAINLLTELIGLALAVYGRTVAVIQK